MSYEEKRVYVKVFGSLPADSPLLTDVPSVNGQQRLHVLAAGALERLAGQVQDDLGIELRIASGWREHLWDSWEHYEQTLIRQYGSVAEGRKWRAFDSPHETGLAIDIGVGGLKPDKKSISSQVKTPLHKWLVKHAYEYGWHPYKKEPWHWEYPLSLAAFQSGSIDDNDPGHDPSAWLTDDHVDDEFVEDHEE